MTKMNHRLNHSRDLTSLAPGPEKKPKRKGFPAKFEGTCANCHGTIRPLTLIVLRADRKPVHSGGCPRKTRRS